MIDGVERKVKQLLDNGMTLAMGEHPPGSSAGIWAARAVVQSAVDAANAEEPGAATVHWSTPRQAHVRVKDRVFRVSVPQEHT